MQSLAGTVKHYEWGSTDDIPAILRKDPDGLPWAEYWLGTHAAGPSVLADNPDVTLDNWMLANPGSLSQREQAAFAGRLPFLMKVLAAAQPLSLQAHPARAEAQAGYADEEARGVPADDPARNFPDDWPKPEMLVALTPFEALSGFRSPLETLTLFDALGVSEEILRPTFGPLRYRDGVAGLAEVFLDCLTMDDTRQSVLNEVLAAAVRHADDDGSVGRFARLAITLDEFHPGDPSLLAALLLNQVRLSPGEGLHTGAGVLHSYLHGVGIEIMACSDNVLRAGLTSKHVDHAALSSIVDFRPAPAAVVRPRREAPGVWRYPGHDAEFALWRLEPTLARQPGPLPGANRARVLLVVEGHVVLGDDAVELVQGQSAFIGADEQPLVAGDATAFLAATGM